MAENQARSKPTKFQINFITLEQHQTMSYNQGIGSQPKSPGVSGCGVEKFKMASPGKSSIPREGNNVSIKKKQDGSSFCSTRATRSPCSNAHLKPIKQDEVVSEIGPTVPRLHSVSEHKRVNRKKVDVADLRIHSRPPNDAHYPFSAVRKNRTKMRSPVCVWCGVQKFMALSARPKLKVRAIGSDADWERWLLELSSNQSDTLTSLTRSAMPKSELSRYMTESQLGSFYKDFAGALIEMVLRELRKGILVERAIMAQVRSSKYHKTERLAKILSRAYEKHSSPRK